MPQQQVSSYVPALQPQASIMQQPVTYGAPQVYETPIQAAPVTYSSAPQVTYGAPQVLEAAPMTQPAPAVTYSSAPQVTYGAPQAIEAPMSSQAAPQVTYSSAPVRSMAGATYSAPQP